MFEQYKFEKIQAFSNIYLSSASLLSWYRQNHNELDYKIPSSTKKTSFGSYASLQSTGEKENFLLEVTTSLQATNV